MSDVLTGQTAIVTGASRGIGEAVAVRLAVEGAHVIATGRDEVRLAEVAETIQNAGGERVTTLPADVLVEADRRKIVATAIEADGKIDILVNNAGVNQVEPSLDVEADTWDKILDTNVKAIFFLTQAAAKEMVARGSGKIINIGSDAGVRGFAEHAAYGASKAALIHLTRILAAEWGGEGIRVNVVCPGATMTGMTAPAMEDKEIRKAILGRGVLDRICEPEEIAGLVAYMARDEAAMITGQAVFMDGGSTAR